MALVHRRTAAAADLREAVVIGKCDLHVSIDTGRWWYGAGSEALRAPACGAAGRLDPGQLARTDRTGAAVAGPVIAVVWQRRYRTCAGRRPPPLGGRGTWPPPPPHPLRSAPARVWLHVDWGRRGC